MNSEEFIQACEDGKLLVWGHEGSRTIKRTETMKMFAYIDLETGAAFIFRYLEQVGDHSVMLIGPGDNTPIGVIPMTDWNILEKEAKE